MLLSLLDAAPELGCEALAPPLAEPELLGCWAELELESLLLGAALAPPEAVPDFDASDDEELEVLGGVTPTDVLDEDEPGVAGVAGEVPPEAELDEEPGALEGDDGVAVSLRALELGDPGADEVRAASSRLHAARPSAKATAIARAESFMCPPWLGYETKQQYARPA